MATKNNPLHPQKRPPHGVLRENHHKNTIFIIALTFLLCSLLFCGAAAADGAHPHTDTTTHDGITFEPWVDEFGNPITDRLPDGGSYYLTANVTLSDTWTVPDGTTNLCLNGHSISLNTEKTGSVISIGSSATLNLYDCGTTGKITDGNAEDGGGVYVKSGTFNMYGGSITGNTASQDGGGVYVGDGTFNMSGNASISENTANGGGGVYVAEGGSFSMSGNASISGNTAWNGGGVDLYGYQNCKFNMEGGSITGNTAWNGGGVCVSRGSSTFNMTGGSITGNTAKFDGGGVYVKSGTFSVKGNASVMNNSSNNVFLSTSNKLNLTGDLTGTVLVTPGYEGEFGTASNTGDAKHIINETNGMYAEITTGNEPGKLIWSDSAFLGTLITLNWNNGSGNTSKIAAFRDETTSFPIAAPTKAAHGFTGWYLEQAGTTLLVNTDGTLVKSDAITEYVDPTTGKWKYNQLELTLYAGWKADKTSITYHDGPTETHVEISRGQTFYVKTPESKPGDEFFGWVYIGDSEANKRFSLYDGTKAIYISDSPYYDGNQKWISYEESLDLYALWASSAVPGPSPSSGDMTVSYQEGGASYTLVIPSELSLTRDRVTQTSISVTNVTVPAGQHVDVTLTSNDVASDDKSKFLLKLTGTNAGEVEYNIACTEYNVKTGQNLIGNNDKVIAEVGTGEGKTKPLFFKMTKDPTTAGTYTGTLTFTASVSS